MSKIRVNSKTKVFVTCPARMATGGPELLHQLVFELRKQHVNAVMYYVNNMDKSPVHSAYKDYKNPFEHYLEDKSENIIVVPEVFTDLLTGINEMQKVIWWLSVDNYYASLNNQGYIKDYANKILQLIGVRKKPFRLDKDFKLPIQHFVQSNYAKQHLIQHGITLDNIHYLSDYLNVCFTNHEAGQTETKEDIVAFNPKKGIEFTQRLIDSASDLKFIPIQNMNREEVSNLLAKAKVYIDFGSHPGKDRIPREAAISGACVITNMQGSARFSEDVPIPDIYKFDENCSDISQIILLIKDCFARYSIHTKNFEDYRKIIRNEHANFINDLSNAFNLKTLTNESHIQL